MVERKRKLFKIAIILAVALAVLVLAYLVLGALAGRQSTPSYEYEFYIPGEEEDYFNDPDILKKDRGLHYTDESGQMTVYTDEINTSDIGPNFFALYFFALEQGESELLNSLYSSEYLEEKGSFDPFTPQRIYAKELKYLYEESADDITFRVTYSLDYNIMKNDGSFRQDIGSDMSRTQYITIRYGEGDPVIESVKSEYRK